MIRKARLLLVFLLVVLYYRDNIPGMLASSQMEYVNFCQCVCNSKSGRKLYVIPTSAGCEACRPVFCEQRIGSDCSGQHVAVTVHCLNRLALLPRIIVCSLLALLASLLLIAGIQKLYPSTTAFFRLTYYPSNALEPASHNVPSYVVQPLLDPPPLPAPSRHVSALATASPKQGWLSNFLAQPPVPWPLMEADADVSPLSQTEREKKGRRFYSTKEDGKHPGRTEIETNEELEQIVDSCLISDSE